MLPQSAPEAGVFFLQPRHALVEGLDGAGGGDGGGEGDAVVLHGEVSVRALGHGLGQRLPPVLGGAARVEGRVRALLPAVEERGGGGDLRHGQGDGGADVLQAEVGAGVEGVDGVDGAPTGR